MVGKKTGRTGRKKDEIWGVFNEVAPPGGTKRAECKFCGSSQAANPQRMVNHIIDVCVSAGDDVKAEVVELLRARLKRTNDAVDDGNKGRLPSSVGPSIINAASSHGGRSSISIPTSSKNKQQRVGDYFAPKMNDAQIKHLDDLLVKALVTGNIPFSFLQNQYFQDFQQHLNAGYRHLNR